MLNNMQMEKIVILGCPGAGKSTFARQLKEKTGIPLFYLDMLWHKADKTTSSKEEFDYNITQIMKQKQWIIDGNYRRTIPARLQLCDTVFLLDYPLEICLASVEARIGKAREDMPWIETEFDQEFKQWILDFPNKQLPRIYAMLQEHQDKEIHVFKSRVEAKAFLDELEM
ncbi:MAG: adenylate kinase [Lachnospiraceae bacterium]|nr:adenylate kinase [Lachnospiraceae bacterium]